MTLSSIVEPFGHGSLCGALGSDPKKHPERAGRYLALTAAHANLITAAMFLTGMAANPLVAKAAADVFGVDFGWGTWALGAVVAGLASLADRFDYPP